MLLICFEAPKPKKLQFLPTNVFRTTPALDRQSLASPSAQSDRAHATLDCRRRNESVSGGGYRRVPLPPSMRSLPTRQWREANWERFGQSPSVAVTLLERSPLMRISSSSGQREYLSAKALTYSTCNYSVASAEGECRRIRLCPSLFRRKRHFGIQ